MTNDLRRFQPGPVAGGLLALCFGGLVPLQVAAQTSIPATDPAYAKFIGTVTGNTVAVTFGSGGKPLASTSAPTLQALGQSSTAGALVRDAQVTTKYGPAVFRVSQGFTVGKLASGVAAIATNPLLAVGLAIAAPFIADWLSDSGVTIDSQGAATVQKSTYTCMVRIGNGMWSSSFPTCIQAANSMLSYYPAGFTASCTEPSLGPSQTWIDNYSTCSIGTSWVRTNATWQGTAPAPATAADVQAAVTANARTLTEIEKIISESVKLDALPTTGNPAPTIEPAPGQTEIKSPTKTDSSTTTNPDGSKVEEVKSCWITGTVNTGASMTMKEVCNTTKTTKDPNGTPTGTTTTTTEAGNDPAAIPEEEGGLCDTLLGKLICTDLGDPPTDEIPRTEKSVQFQAEILFGSGTCPANRSLNIGGQMVEVFDFAQFCGWLEMYVKPLAIMLATFTASLLVFTGRTE